MINYSRSAQNMRSSEIRRLMKLAADPSIISFAGGMPSNQLFPIDAINEIFNNLPLTLKQVACQYGPTQGFPPLLESLKEYLKSKGLPLDNSQDLIITTGAQQAINLLSKVLLDPGDTVVTEYPSFIGAIAAFKSYQANLLPIALDNDGIIIDQLIKTLDDPSNKNIKMIYLCPTFHNPAGIIYSRQRRIDLLTALKGREICLLEDDPYGELYFNQCDAETTRSIKSLGTEAFPHCYTGSFAKIFGPGMRLGWLLGPREIVEKMELAKQSQDACSSTFTQVLANQFLSDNRMPAYLDMLRPTYARRAKTMLDALDRYMPAGITWTTPRGGFYLWVTLPHAMNSSAVFDVAIKGGAAFVIGSAFDPLGTRNNTIRLAYSHSDETKIEHGIKIIADAIKSIM